MPQAIVCGDACTYETISEVPVPPDTASYGALAHDAYADAVRDIAQEILPDDWEFQSAQYALAQEGQQMFGAYIYEHPLTTEMGIAIGFRNSYNKTIAAGLACGAGVFLCSNLVINGDVVIFRKHTKNIRDDLPNKIRTAIGQAIPTFQAAVKDREILKDTPLSDDQAYSILGILRGRGIIGSSPMNHSIKMWNKPVDKAWEPRTAWSLENCVNASLKKAHPTTVLQQLSSLHTLLMEQANFDARFQESNL